MDSATRDQLIATQRRFVDEKLRPAEALVAGADAVPQGIVDGMKDMGLSMEEEALVCMEIGRTMRYGGQGSRAFLKKRTKRLLRCRVGCA